MKDYIRKTKIICTLGPSTDGVLRQLMESGMNVGRFNFSHGTHEEHAKRVQEFDALRKELNLPVARLLDTKGPEIRIGDFENGSIMLKEGQKFTLTTEEMLGNEEKVTVSYKELPQDVKEGNNILIDDGLINMRVDKTTNTDIECTVLNGGKISNKKGVNVPNVDLSMPFMSEKDKSDLLFGIEHDFDFIAASFTRTADDINEMRQNKKGVNVPNVDLSMPFMSEKDKSDLLFGIEHDFDFIAASFTRTADDINEMRQFLKDHGETDVKIIAKIESNQGVANIDSIIEAADGIMVARGDMGVEIPLEEVPSIQRMIIKKVYKSGKYVVTATQMLDSMIKNPRPTRAEATDVANAVYEGTSAVMLSGETAAGKYPVEAVQTMVKIAERAEKDIDYVSRLSKRKINQESTISDAVSHSACTMAADIKASAIISVSMSGRTVRMVSKYRPESPIIAGCIQSKVWRQMALSWGVTPIYIDKASDSEELFANAIDAAKKSGLVKEGEKVIITAGVPVGVSGVTNLIKAVKIK